MIEPIQKSKVKQRHQWLTKYVSAKMPAYLRSSEDDVIQDVTMKLLRADKKSGEFVENYGYMKQTVMSVIIDYIRKYKNHQGHEDEYNENVSLDPQVNRQKSPEQMAHQQSMIEHVYQAIAQLSEIRQSTLMLYLRGMKIKEIAELSDMKIANVRNEIYRGKADVLNILNARGVNYEI
ncbi:MAG: sigma-70 family RNA polymerase sigma factor [Proteobacteria bacterium]|nr:sigma-70 family RNA polymerase sigma factor [Pseudomonadota bacterium]